MLHNCNISLGSFYPHLPRTTCRRSPNFSPSPLRPGRPMITRYRRRSPGPDRLWLRRWAGLGARSAQHRVRCCRLRARCLGAAGRSPRRVHRPAGGHPASPNYLANYSSMDQVVWAGTAGPIGSPLSRQQCEVDGPAWPGPPAFVIHGPQHRRFTGNDDLAHSAASIIQIAVVSSLVQLSAPRRGSSSISSSDGRIICGPCDLSNPPCINNTTGKRRSLAC